MLGKKNTEYEFLPDVLEVTETPASPGGRIVIWLIFLILLTTLLISYFGEVDEVAVARGKLISAGRIRVVQSVQSGKLISINIGEGQEVKEGDLLFTLDSTLSEVEIDALKSQLETYQEEYDVNIKLVNEVTADQGYYNSSVAKAAIAQNELYEQKKEELESSIEQQSAVLAGARELAQGIAHQIEFLQKRREETENIYSLGSENETELVRLENNLLYWDLTVERIGMLLESGAVSRNEYDEALTQQTGIRDAIETQKKKVEIEKLSNAQALSDIDVMISEKQDNFVLQSIKISEAQAQIEITGKSIKRLEAERLSMLWANATTSEQKIDEINKQLRKLEKANEYNKITAPVSGIIQSVSKNTVGEVVEPNHVLATIVPSDAPLVVEAYLTNRDIGFISVGQEVSLKFDTFEYQRYGLVDGLVEYISPDAVEIENSGTMYLVNVELLQDSMTVDGAKVLFSPGMAVSAEIKTGKRRIISFFFDQLVKYAHEGLQVR